MSDGVHDKEPDLGDREVMEETKPVDRGFIDDFTADDDFIEHEDESNVDEDE